jgi:8-oxo-dGTP diphosphatase
MKRTTLCYIENSGAYLMLYRDRKPDDPNEGKWLGIGGKIEPGEEPDECNNREVLEETGLVLRSAHFHGIIKFRADSYEDEDMYLYSSDDFVPDDPAAAEFFSETGEYKPPFCSEGELAWIPKDQILNLNMWEGDRAFVEKLMAGAASISMRLQYSGESCEVVSLL